MYRPRFIVPSYLLKHIAESEHNEEKHRKAALKTLGHMEVLEKAAINFERALGIDFGEPVPPGDDEKDKPKDDDKKMPPQDDKKKHPKDDKKKHPKPDDKKKKPPKDDDKKSPKKPPKDDDKKKPPPDDDKKNPPPDDDKDKPPPDDDKDKPPKDDDGDKPPKDDDEGSPKRADREVHDAKNSSDESDLPGKLARAEGDPPVKDKAVNETYDNVGTVLKFYKEHFKWKSIDNKNTDVISTVHFGEKYENACQCLSPPFAFDTD